jgi:hypothetical protein
MEGARDDGGGWLKDVLTPLARFVIVSAHFWTSSFHFADYTARWALGFESHPGHDFSTDFKRRPTELQAPTPNSLVRTHEASLREQVFYVSKIQGEPIVEPDEGVMISGGKRWPRSSDSILRLSLTEA